MLSVRKKSRTFCSRPPRADPFVRVLQRTSRCFESVCCKLAKGDYAFKDERSTFTP